MFDKRVDAGAQLAAAGAGLLRSTGYSQTRSATVGELAGFDLEVEATKVVAAEVTVRTADGLVEARWTEADWRAAEPARLVTAIERRLSRLEQELELAVAGGDKAAAECNRANTRLGQGFEHGRELILAQHRQREIAALLTPGLDAEDPRLSRAPVPAR